MRRAEHEAPHLRLLPLPQGGHVLEGEPEDRRDHHLRQRRRELRHVLDRAPLDPAVDELVHEARDHLRVATGAHRPHPRVRELLAVPPVLLHVRTQDLPLHFLPRVALAVVERERLRVPHDARHVLVLREDEPVLVRRVTAPRDAQHGRVLVQDAVRIEPVLLRARREQVVLRHCLCGHQTPRRARLGGQTQPIPARNGPYRTPPRKRLWVTAVASRIPTRSTPPRRSDPGCRPSSRSLPPCRPPSGRGAARS